MWWPDVWAAMRTPAQRPGRAPVWFCRQATASSRASGATSGSRRVRRRGVHSSTCALWDSAARRRRRRAPIQVYWRGVEAESRTAAQFQRTQFGLPHLPRGSKQIRPQTTLKRSAFLLLLLERVTFAIASVEHLALRVQVVLNCVDSRIPELSTILPGLSVMAEYFDFCSTIAAFKYHLR